MNRKLSISFKYLSLLLCIFLLYWFLRDKDLSLIFAEAIGFNFFFFIFVTGLAQLLATIAWKYSFNSYPLSVSFSRLFLIRLCGESFALINPTNVIGGEGIKALMLKKLSVSYKDSASSLIVSRFLVIGSLVFLLLIAFFFLFDTLFMSFGLSISTVEAGLVIGIIVVLLFCVLYLAYKTGQFVSLPFRLLLFFFPNVKRIKAFFDKAYSLDELLFLTIRLRKAKLIVAFMLSMFHWLLGAFEIYLILYFLGFVSVSFFSCFLMEMGISLFKAVGSFVPGQIGVEEYANKFMLDITSVGLSNTWVALSILRRGRQVFWVLLGIILMPFFIGKGDFHRLRFSAD